MTTSAAVRVRVCVCVCLLLFVTVTATAHMSREEQLRYASGAYRRVIYYKGDKRIISSEIDPSFIITSAADYNTPASAPPPYSISEENILYYEAQSTDIATSQAITSQSAWDSAAAWMAQVNSDRQAAAESFSLLYSEDIQSNVSALLLSPYCAVPTSTILYNNATAAVAFLCCQLEDYMYPGILKLVQDAFATFLGLVPLYALAQSPSQMLINIRQIMTNDLIQYKIDACIDDNRLLQSQRSYARAQEAQMLVDVFSVLYTTMNADAETLQSCLNTTSCLTNSTIPLIPDYSTYFSFQDYNAQYQSACSGAALAAFETAKYTQTCS